MNTVLTFCVGSAVVGLAGASSAQTAHDGLWPLQSFESSSIKTPFLNVTKNGKSELGYLFFSPMDMVRGTGYPAIYQDDGELVWQGPEGDNFAFQVQMLNGEPVLTYFQGLLNPVVGFGIGSISILNSSYHEIHHVTLPGELNFKTIYDPKPFQSYMNIQEDFITDQGSIVVTATNVTQADLRPVGGPEDGWVLDELFYEIDIESNDILFQWSALDHLAELPFSDSRRGLAGAGRSEKDPWHYMSLNSVAKYGDSYLMSSHFMCGAYFISSKGTVLWHLDVSLAPTNYFNFVFVVAANRT